MIPSTAGFLSQDFEIREQPEKTYLVDWGRRKIRGFTEGQEAVKQAVYKILNTERYRYLIYSWEYGIETMDLYGEPVSWVCPELERRIAEALTWDSRVTGVTDFVFDRKEKGKVHAAFTVHTIYGDVLAEKEVKI